MTKTKHKKPVKHHVVTEIHPAEPPIAPIPIVVPPEAVAVDEPTVIVALPKSAWETVKGWFVD